MMKESLQSIFIRIFGWDCDKQNTLDILLEMIYHTYKQVVEELS